MLPLAGCPLLWVSKMQMEIALSMTEAEYIALSQSMHELLSRWLLLQEVTQHLGLHLGNEATQSTMFEENQGNIMLAMALKMTPRSKHIGIKKHFFVNMFQKGLWRLSTLHQSIRWLISLLRVWW